MTTEEPTVFSVLIAEHLAARIGDSSVRAVLEAARDGHHRNQRRRAAILSHDDLRQSLEQLPLGFRRATRWNGYIPPAIVNPGEPETLRQVHRLQDNTVRYWLNPKHNQALGGIPNDSPQRAALIEISTEAWQREHQTPQREDQS